MEGRTPASRPPKAGDVSCDPWSEGWLCHAARRDGARAVVVGRGPLALAARRLAADAPLPVVEPIPAAIRLALRRAAP